MDEEEPTLPTLPAVSRNAGSHCVSGAGNPRKRRKQLGRTESPQPLASAHESSDPAFFSGDDDPSVDNYSNRDRRKKRYVGSWFHQRPTSPDSPSSPSSDAGATAAHDSKRALTRQVDSGIYMGSDLTDDDYEPDRVMEPPRRDLPISLAERRAQAMVQENLDRGIDCFDFYSMGLDEIPGDIISRLRAFAYIPDVVMDAGFTQDAPQLKLLMTNNSLTRLPGALFDLSIITVLSLRGNELTELPPAVCRLTNLETLNLAQNRLGVLPAELLDLMRPPGNLRDLTLFPNPFVQPRRPFEYGPERPGFAPAIVRYVFRTHQEEIVRDVPSLLSRYIARSPAQIANSGGLVLSDFRLSIEGNGTVEVFGDDDDNTQNSRVRVYQGRAGSSRPSAVPSLVEAVLRSCDRSGHLCRLASCVPEDLGHLRALIHRAAAQRDQGALACSRCRRVLIVPAVEWIEWRELRTTRISRITFNSVVSRSLIIGQLTRNKAEMAVPFHRRACSWRCGPEGHERDSGLTAPHGGLLGFDGLPPADYDLQSSSLERHNGDVYYIVRD